MGGGMGLRDITLFSFIVVAYLISFLVYLVNRMFSCEKTVSDEDAMWASFVGATFGMILVFIYAILVYTGKCGGYKEYNDKQKVIAFVSVSLLLVSSLGAEITIWKITKPYGSHQVGWVLDSEEICNWGFVFVLFCVITLFISWFYTGASIPGLLNELTDFKNRYS
jgi:hypothetical protein